MTANVSDWVWKHSRAAKGARLVLLAIAHESDREGAAIVSVPELAAKTLLSERAVYDAVAELARLGEVEVWTRTGGHSRSAYRVIMGRGAKSAPLGGAGYAPRHAGVQNLHPAESAGVRGAESAGVSARSPRSDPQKPGSTPARGADSAPQENDPHVVSTTGRSQADLKDVPANDERTDVQRLCSHLADRIEANGSKRPVITAKWQQAARLMLDKDGRTEEQVTTAINWSQDHEFWRSNILSMPKLREKYDQLRLQASRRNGQRPTRQQETDQLFDRAMERARAREGNVDSQRNGHPDPVRQSALPSAGN